MLSRPVQKTIQLVLKTLEKCFMVYYRRVCFNFFFLNLRKVRSKITVAAWLSNEVCELVNAL